MTQINKEENLSIKQEGNRHEWQFIQLADEFMDRIQAKRGKATLPWTGNTVEEAQRRRVEGRAYLYTIWALNAIEDENIEEFNKAKLEKWRVLPVYDQFVMPAAVKYDLNSAYDNLLDRSRFMLDGKFFGEKYNTGYLMTVDQFNDFTDWVSGAFNMDASSCKTFDKLRTSQTLANVADKAAYAEETTGYGDVPVTLHFRFHKKSRLAVPVYDVMKEFIGDKVLEEYKRHGNKPKADQ